MYTYIYVLLVVGLFFIYQMERQYKKEGANTQILTNENVMKNGGNAWRRSSDVNTNVRSGKDMMWLHYDFVCIFRWKL